MGDFAEQIVNGEICQGCAIQFSTVIGYAAFCSGCQEELNCDTIGIPVKVNKVRCTQCRKYVSPIGMRQHIQAVHGTNAESINAIPPHLIKRIEIAALEKVSRELIEYDYPINDEEGFATATSLLCGIIERYKKE